MARENKEPIVCDFGTSLIKAGFAGVDRPEVVVPCYKGDREPNSNSWLSGFIDCDEMEEIFGDTINNELKVSPEEHHFLLTQPTLKHDANGQEKNDHRKNRENMCEAMFEAFNVPAMYVSFQPVLALINSAKLSGFVLDLGATSGQCVPIYEGQVIPHAVHEFGVAGNDLTNHLSQLLTERGNSFTSQAEHRIVDDIKRIGYVAIDYKKELKKISRNSSASDMSYELPDGEIMTIGAERFKCPEALFQPSVAGIDGIDGIHKVVYKSIMMCHEDFIRKDLFGNIFLCGGSTLFSGFSDRFNKELSMLIDRTTSIDVVTLPERQYNVWIGGSILASLSNFQQMCVKKSEYEENGVTIMHDRCYY